MKITAAISAVFSVKLLFEIVKELSSNAVMHPPLLLPRFELNTVSLAINLLKSLIRMAPPASASLSVKVTLFRMCMSAPMSIEIVALSL